MARKFLLSLALTGLLISAAGCGISSSFDVQVPKPDRGTIGLAMPTVTVQRWIDDGNNMVKQFQLLGYKTDLRNAKDDIPTQVDQIEEMVKNRVKVLVIGAIDGTALKQVLADAKDAGIPVISYDRLIRDTANIDFYATFDNFRVGVLQAQYLVQALGLHKGKGPFNIELFAGSPDDNNATFFFNGAMSVLRPYLKSKKLVVRSGKTALKEVGTPGWDGTVAQKRMAQLLAGPLDDVRVDAVLAPNDGISRGILAALRDAGYGKSKRLPVLTGQDAELDSVKLIAAGQQAQTVYKDTRELAKVTVQMADALLNGGTPMVNDTTQYHNGVKTVPTFLLQPVSVDKSNYQRVLVQSGYYTAEEISG